MSTRTRALLVFGFAGSVMADPVSSVTYAIEAAARQLEGRLHLLLMTMTLVVVCIGIIAASYWQLVGEYPDGGGSAEAAGDVFGDGWAFLPLGALVVDFVLTVAVSVSAASAALIAWWPALHPFRLPMGLLLLGAVTALVASGARGRLAFGAMTAAFVVCALAVAGGSLDALPASQAAVSDVGGTHGSLLVLLAMSGAMALATGIEAPSSAIAELEVGSAERRRFGRLTIAATVVVVSLLTIVLTALVAAGGEQLSSDTLLSAAIRNELGSGPVFATFQVTSALLLLAAASSSLQAGPGIVRALSGSVDGAGTSILPAWTGRSTDDGAPWVAVLLFACASGAVLAIAGADEQTLVVFYAASVFLGFAFGISAMARTNLLRRAWGPLAINLVGLVATMATLAASAARGWPLVSLAASTAIALLLWLGWRGRGRPPLRIARSAASDA